MRVHFSAAMPCALRIGGAAAGMCGEAEKFADLPCGEELLVEFLPADGDYFPLSFIMSADFFARPPQGVEAYLYDCGADVRAARFAPRSPALRVLAQARAAGMLLTAFDWGGPRLCAEGRGFACLDLPSSDVDLGEEHIGGEVFARALCRGGRADDPDRRYRRSRSGGGTVAVAAVCRQRQPATAQQRCKPMPDEKPTAHAKQLEQIGCHATARSA